MTGRETLPEDTWRPVLEWLDIQREQQGRLTAAMLDAAGDYLGRSADQVRRRYNQWSGRGPTPRPPALKLTTAQKTVLAASPSVAAGWRDLQATDDTIGSYSRLNRAVDRLDTGEWAAIKRRGPIDVPGLSEHLYYEIEGRNDSGVADNKQLSQWCLNDFGRPVRLWLTTVMEEKFRVIRGWALYEGAPNATITVATIAASQIGFISANGTVVTGRFERFHHDRGKDLDGNYRKQFSRGIKMLGHANPSYTPELDGILESFHNRIDNEFSATFPGTTHGPQERWHRRSNNNLFMPPDLTRLPHMDSVRKFFTSFVHDWNEIRIHPELGTTAIAGWAADPTPLIDVPIEVMARAMLRVEGTRLVEHRGISVGGQWYILDPSTAPKELRGTLGGRRVEVRTLPRTDHVTDYIAVFFENKFRGLARNKRLITAQHAGTVQDRRGKDLRESRALVRSARDLLQQRFDLAIENDEPRMGPLSGVPTPGPLPRLDDNGLSEFEE